MANDIDISVMIPTFRREQELLNAVNSVLEIQQLNIEVLISDDSPEGSAAPFIEKVKDERVHYEKRRHPTGGLPAVVRNDLAQSANGRVFYFLDDDDTVVSRTLVEMYEKLMLSSAGVAIGVIRPVGDPDSPVVIHEQERYAFTRTRIQTYISKYQFYSRLLNNFPLLVCSAAMVKQDVFHRVGGFNVELPLWEDVDFYLRAARESGYLFVDRVLLNRKTGGDSLVQNAKDDTRIEESFRMMSSMYRQKYGTAEWALLKMLNRLHLV